MVATYLSRFLWDVPNAPLRMCGKKTSADRKTVSKCFYSTLSWFVHKRRHGRRFRAWGTGHRLGKEVFQFRKRGFGLGLIIGGFWPRGLRSGDLCYGAYTRGIKSGGTAVGGLWSGVLCLGAYVQGFMYEGCWSTSALVQDGLCQRA